MNSAPAITPSSHVICILANCLSGAPVSSFTSARLGIALPSAPLRRDGRTQGAVSLLGPLGRPGAAQRGGGIVAGMNY